MRYRILVALLLCTTTPCFAQAVKDLTPDAINKNMESLPPEIRDKMMQKFQEMTPEQRDAIKVQAHQALSQISAERKQLFKEKAMDKFQSLSPTDAKELTAEAAKSWENMDPKDKEELAQKVKEIMQRPQ